jgi:hypothetical protein
MIKLFSVNRILWAVYLSLLGVLLPHTIQGGVAAQEQVVFVQLERGQVV